MVSRSGSMWVEMNARDVKIVAAHCSDSLVALANDARIADVSGEQGYAKVCDDYSKGKQKTLLARHLGPIR